MRGKQRTYRNAFCAKEREECDLALWGGAGGQGRGARVGLLAVVRAAIHEE